MIAGKPPTDGVQIAACRLDGERWVLYLRPTASNSEWLALKLCSDGEVESKANFWLGWNRQKHKLARNKSTQLLEQHRPMLWRWARESLDPTIGDDRIAPYIDVDPIIESYASFADLLGVQA